MPTHATMLDVDVFMPWEKDLYVEIENAGIARSAAAKGSTLFDHIMEVYFTLVKTIPQSNLDDFLTSLEINDFSRQFRYIKLKINRQKTRTSSLNSKRSYTSAACFDIL